MVEVDVLVGIRRQPKKLEDTCIQVIANNFEKLLSNPGVKRGLAYLQKRPQLLLLEFAKKRPVPLNHALFCLTTNLQYLDFQWFKAADTHAIIKKLGEIKSNLTDLNVEGIKDGLFKGTLLDLAYTLPKTLRYLSVHMQDCTVDNLKVIAERCPHLQELNFKYCRINFAGIRAMCSKDEEGNICPNTELCKLDFDSCVKELSPDALDDGHDGEFIIQNFPNLTEINSREFNRAVYNKYRKFVLNNRPPHIITNVKSIVIFELFHDDDYNLNLVKAFITFCPHITKLKILVSSQEQVDLCAKFTSLVDVEFECKNIFSFLFQPFLKVRGHILTTLSFKACFVTYVIISPHDLVEFCPNLESLRLCRPKFTEVESCECNSEHVLSSLTSLTVENPLIDNLEDSLSYLIKHSPNLEKFKYATRQCSVLSYLFIYNSLRSCTTLKEVFLENIEVDIDTFTNSFYEFDFHSP